MWCATKALFAPKGFRDQGSSLAGKLARSHRSLLMAGRLQSSGKCLCSVTAVENGGDTAATKSKVEVAGLAPGDGFLLNADAVDYVKMFGALPASSSIDEANTLLAPDVVRVSQGSWKMEKPTTVCTQGGRCELCPWIRIPCRHATEEKRSFAARMIKTHLLNDAAPPMRELDAQCNGAMRSNSARKVVLFVARESSADGSVPRNAPATPKRVLCDDVDQMSWLRLYLTEVTGSSKSSAQSAIDARSCFIATLTMKRLVTALQHWLNHGVVDPQLKAAILCFEVMECCVRKAMHVVVHCEIDPLTSSLTSTEELPLLWSPGGKQAMLSEEEQSLVACISSVACLPSIYNVTISTIVRRKAARGPRGSRDHSPCYASTVFPSLIRGTMHPPEECVRVAVVDETTGEPTIHEVLLPMTSAHHELKALSVINDDVRSLVTDVRIPFTSCQRFAHSVELLLSTIANVATLVGGGQWTLLREFLVTGDDCVSEIETFEGQSLRKTLVSSPSGDEKLGAVTVVYFPKQQITECGSKLKQAAIRLFTSAPPLSKATTNVVVLCIESNCNDAAGASERQWLAVRHVIRPLQNSNTEEEEAVWTVLDPDTAKSALITIVALRSKCRVA